MPLHIHFEQYFHVLLDDLSNNLKWNTSITPGLSGISSNLIDNISNVTTNINNEDELIFTTVEKGSFDPFVSESGVASYPKIGESRFILSVAYGNSLADKINLLPNNVTLHPIYPNPFNPVLNIDFDINQAGWVKVNIADITGSIVKTVYEGYEGLGKHHLSWDSDKLPSGTYFVTLEFENSSLTKKVVLLK